MADRLLEALGPNGQLIIDLIPEMHLIIGDQPPVSDLLPRDAQQRFQGVVQNFIGVFARLEHPLALFLDDLQWLDAATLELLAAILPAGKLRHLLLIGAYRDNEVTPAHPLMRCLEEMRRAKVRVQDIVLTPLTCDELGYLLADAFNCDPRRTTALVQLMHQKTGGTRTSPFNSFKRWQTRSC